MGGSRPDRASFAHQLERFGDAPALVLEHGETINYRALAAQADAFAARLGSGRRLLAIEMQNDPEAVAAYLGALRSGHVALLLPGSAAARNVAIDETYAPDARYSYQDGWDLRLERHAETPLHPELSLLLSTSGTTGAAKLVRLSLDAIDSNARSIVNYLGIGPGDRAITSLPLFYSYGLSVLNSHLAQGATLLLTARSVVEPGFWDFFEREGGTSIAGVPHTYELMEQAGVRRRSLPTLRTLTQAGGRLAAERVAELADWAERSGRRFFVMYGQTEATARMAYLPPEQARVHPDCIGVAIPGGCFDLIGEDGARVDTAPRIGELVYRGPNVMMGYALSRSDLIKGCEIDALHTGDLAEQTEDGLFRIVGRKSRFCKPFGLRVSLDELESVLGKMGLSGAVTGNDELIAIAYRGNRDADRVLAEISQALNLPAAVFDVARLDQLPVLPSGKRDYQAILAAAQARRETAQAEECSAGFAKMFEFTLSRPNIATTDSFETLEGDSLSYVTFATEIERRLGYLPQGWERLSVADLDRLALVKRQQPRWFSWVETDVVLRALAICAVVLTHSKLRLGVGGGADVLMILGGYSLARFDFRRLTSSGGWPVLRRFLLRVVLPYYVILIGYSLLRKTPDPSSFLLIGVFWNDAKGLLSVYWFIEAFAQILLILSLVFAVPAVRKFAAAYPFAFAMVFLTIAMGLRIAAYQLFHHDDLLNRTVDATMPLFALGFALYVAQRWWERLTCVAFAALLSLATIADGPFGGWVSAWQPGIGELRARWVVGATLALVLISRLPLPLPIARVVTGIAAISFTIYVVHMVPVHLLVELDLGSGWLALPAAILFAFLVTLAASHLTPALRHWRTARRPHVPELMPRAQLAD